MTSNSFSIQPINTSQTTGTEAHCNPESLDLVIVQAVLIQL